MPVASQDDAPVLSTPAIGTGGGNLRVDLCVIGGGSGGLSVAAAAAQLGVSVALIEKDKMGGDCLNYGCVPSKALIAAGRRAHLIRSSAPFGIAPCGPRSTRRGPRPCPWGHRLDRTRTTRLSASRDLA